MKIQSNIICDSCNCCWCSASETLPGSGDGFGMGIGYWLWDCCVCGGAAGGGVTFEPGIPWWVPKCYSQWWTRDLLDLKVCLACPPERGLVIYKPVFFWPLQFLCNLSQISGESVYSLYPSLFLGFTLYSVCLCVGLWHSVTSFFFSTAWRNSYCILWEVINNKKTVFLWSGWP